MKAMNHGVVFKEQISGVINSAQRPEPGWADRALRQARCPAPCHPQPPSQPSLSYPLQPSLRSEAATLPLWFFVCRSCAHNETNGASACARPLRTERADDGSGVAGNELPRRRTKAFPLACKRAQPDRHAPLNLPLPVGAKTSLSPDALQQRPVGAPPGP